MTKTIFQNSLVIALCIATKAFGFQADPNPTTVTLPAGAWVSVRVNQPLSSDKSQAGDTFSATLTQPLIANGMVVARRGQTVLGRVTETSKGGRVKGTSRLGIEIVELSLVDGQNMPVRTQLVETTAGTSNGRDATAVATTTGLGAMIGGAAAGGAGAGLGAIAGAGASIIGVLATKGRQTEIYPEDLVSFRTLAPITIPTAEAAHAFQPVRQDDYSPSQTQPRFVTRQASMVGPYPYAFPFMYDPFWGGGYGYGWGPRFAFYGRPGFYGGGRGFRRIR